MNIFRRAILAAWLAVAVPFALGDQEFDKLKSDFEKAQQEWFQKYMELQKEQGPDAEVDITKLPPRPEKEFLPRYRAYAEKNAGKPEAIPALAWLTQVSGAIGEKDGKGGTAWAIERLTKDHAAQPEIADALLAVQYAQYEIGRGPLLALAERVIKDNKDDNAVASGKFLLAILLYETPNLNTDDKRDAAADKKRAVELFRDIAKNHAKSKVAERAAGFVFELEKLQIGMVAPDFEGTDADGKTIKLSQFRGQVVVIDFWGFW